MPLTELHVPCDLGGHGDLGGHVPRDLGGHVPKVEVVGDHRIVSNQRVRLKLRACESFQEKIFSDQTGEIFSKHLWNNSQYIWRNMNLGCGGSGCGVQVQRLSCWGQQVGTHLKSNIFQNTQDNWWWRPSWASTRSSCILPRWAWPAAICWSGGHQHLRSSSGDFQGGFMWFSRGDYQIQCILC